MATVKEANIPESQKCEHKKAEHHSRGKCVQCYNAWRHDQRKRKTKLAKSWEPLKTAKKKSATAGSK